MSERTQPGDDHAVMATSWEKKLAAARAMKAWICKHGHAKGCSRIEDLRTACTCGGVEVIRQAEKAGI